MFTGDDDGPAPRVVPQVALSALKKERERRRRMDTRVRELEEELQRYNQQKFGLDEDEPGEVSADAGQIDDTGRFDTSSADSDYSNSLRSFTAKHGQGEVDAVDAALKRLTPSQRQEVVGIIGSSRDPVASIHAYVKQAGLLGLERRSLQDVLDGKGKQAPNDLDEIKQQVAGLSQREQSLHVAERRAIEAAARSDFTSEFGRQSFIEMDNAVGQLIQSGHPAVAELRDIYLSSPRPAYAVAQKLHEWGVWSPSDTAPQQRQQQPTVFPSNIATARSASPRRGPAWTGPKPLQDIFDRTRSLSE